MNQQHIDHANAEILRRVSDAENRRRVRALRAGRPLGRRLAARIFTPSAPLA